MSFVIERVVTPIKVFNSLLGAAIKGEPETLSTTYTITSIVSIVGTKCIAEYTVEPVGAAVTGKGIIEFDYSCTGNPLEEAETALLSSLQ